MKKLSVLMLVLVLLLCSCNSEAVPPNLTIAENIRHNSGTDFKIEDYCTTESLTDGDVKLSFSGNVDTDTCGDYKIKVTARDESGGETSKDVVVTVQENRSGYSSDTVCKMVRDYILDFRKSGNTNIEFFDYADGFGNMAYASTATGDFTYNGFEGCLYFESYQLEEKKSSFFNMIFMMDEEAMGFFPLSVTLSAGDMTLDLGTTENVQMSGQYGFYTVLNRFNESYVNERPDYEYIEKMSKIADYEGKVILTTTAMNDTFEMEFSEQQKKDFRNMLNIYKEMLTYY